MKHKFFFRNAVLAAALLAVCSASAQQVVTKSGTVVTPAPRQAPAEMSKQTAPPPSAGSRPVYIAVCPADLAAALQPLLQWRRQQGFQVELVCPTTNKRDTIRQQLQQRYLGATPLRPAQRYVLLAGDVDRIQAFIGKHTPNGLNSSVTDLYYGEYTGDYLPEAAVGRLPAADSAELALMVAKIIQYEQGRWADQQHQLLLAAGSENSPLATTTTNGQVSYLAHLAADFRPELDTACFYNPSSADQLDLLTATLDQGNALVNYTAHCTRAGWSNPTLGALGIDTLQYDSPTIYVNNCCLSNAFDGTCFGEQLLRMQEGGAAGVIGATNETLWNEDFYWAVGAHCPPSLHPQHDNLRPGAFDALMTQHPDDLAESEREEAFTLGNLLRAGCRAVSQSGSVFDAFYWETYCLLGDPATNPFMGAADTLALTILDTLSIGCTQLHFAATPGCRISAMADTLLLGSTTADENGEARLFLTQPLTTDTLLLTASRHNCYPLIIRLAAQPASDACLAVTAYRLTEQPATTLTVLVKNISNKHACRHLLTLWQDSADQADGFRTATAAPAELTLAPGADTSLSISLEQLIPGAMPILRARLSLSDSNNHTYSTLHIATEVSDQRPLITSLQILDSVGCAVRQLIPGRRYQAACTFMAEPDSVTWGGEGIVWDDEAQFTVAGDSSTHITVTPHKYSWYQTFDYYFTCYRGIEDFEDGLSHYPWEINPLFPWSLDAAESHHGHQALRSGAIGNNQQSEIVLEIDAASDDSLYFWLNVSSEAGDFLNFYVDGKRRGWWSGNTGWKQWGCPIAAGRHQLRWSYQKNASGTERSDCAWIDEVQLPFCCWTTPYGISSGRPLSAIPAPAGEARLEIRPNPASGDITITMESNSQARIIALYDPLGRLADKIFLAPGCNSVQYSAAHLRYNTYTLVLYNEQQQPIATRKLIVTAN